MRIRRSFVFAFILAAWVFLLVRDLLRWIGRTERELDRLDANESEQMRDNLEFRTRLDRLEAAHNGPAQVVGEGLAGEGPAAT